jgi:hypothetical protein
MKRALLDRLEPWANPLLVREISTSTHSRPFLGVLWAALFVALIAYVALHGELGYPVAPALLSVVAVLLLVVGAIGVPLATYARMRRETLSGTAALIQITRLTARRQVRGHLLACGARLLMLYALLAPFAAAAYLYPGVSLAQVTLVLWSTLLLAVFMSAVMVYLGAPNGDDVTASPNAGSAIGVVTLGVAGALGLLTVVANPEDPPDDLSWSALLPVIAAVSAGVLLFVWLLMADAKNKLTCSANRCSDEIKVVVLIGVAAATLTIALSVTNEAYAATALTGISSGVFGCAVVNIASVTSRTPARLCRRLDRWPRFARLLYFPLLDGPGPGAAYLGIGVVVILVAGGIVRLRGGAPPFATLAMIGGAIVPAAAILGFEGLAEMVAPKLIQRFGGCQVLIGLALLIAGWVGIGLRADADGICYVSFIVVTLGAIMVWPSSA